MELFNMLGQASIMARVSLLVTLFPLAAGLAYLFRPTEQRLALMRPSHSPGSSAASPEHARPDERAAMVWDPQSAAVAAEHGDRRGGIARDALRGIRMPDGCVALRRAGDAAESVVESREPGERRAQWSVGIWLRNRYRVSVLRWRRFARRRHL